MASRAAQKEEARQRRLEHERTAAVRARKRRRLQTLTGVLLVAVILVGVGIALSIHSGRGASDNARLAQRPHSKQAVSEATYVQRLLKGIPQHGDTLGNPKAPVTFTEYGDLECSVCDQFALHGGENELISNDVRSGKVKLVYKSLETATLGQGSDASTIFTLQQSAAYAAGVQSKAWNYILLFYHEQGTEDTPYVTTTYLTGLAKQIPGLNLATWDNDRFNPKYAEQIKREATQYSALDVSRPGTPTLIATGHKSQTQPVVGAAPYTVVEQMIKLVS